MGIFESDFDCLTDFWKCWPPDFNQSASRLRRSPARQTLPRQTSHHHQASPTAPLSVMQWLKGEPLLEQVLFVLMGGFIVMLFCQLFLGMGAIGSQPKFQQESPAEYAYDKVFGMHPVEKILVEETGVQTPEEA